GQFWSVKGRRAAMKHVFVGTARVASKLMPPPGWDDVPRGTVDSTEPGTTPTTVNNDSGCDPSYYQPQKCAYLPGGDPVLNDYYADAKVRPETYYYHPDHLGSTSWVTDQNARVHEPVEYFPYGEVWRDTRSDVGASPVKGQRFLFTGKEIDEETGLYYFGARYYDPVRVRWASPDPILGQYLDGQRGAGGVFRPVNLDLFHYAGNNPLGQVDVTGEDDVYFSENGTVAETVKAKTTNVYLRRKGDGGNNADKFIGKQSDFNEVVATVYAEANPGDVEEAKGIAQVIQRRASYTGATAQDVVSNPDNHIEGYGKRKWVKAMGALSIVESQKPLPKDFGLGEPEALQTAIAGTLYAMSGGADVTGGAFFWGHGSLRFYRQKQTFTIKKKQETVPIFEKVGDAGALDLHFYNYASRWKQLNKHPKEFP
ncbi:RHS repeat-associated core domain-containing protein, partial [Anaeromyxobacter oryzisoli]|uniref:RHS repeat-associated core domain-containing protein n=1 Tax=Anaeromyxobacter oryzisoli TaxID=2925408 RepID=UPI002413808F